MEQKEESLVEYRLTQVEQKIDKVLEVLEEKFVTKTEFEPVKKVVYGLVGVTLISVLGAVLALVIK